MNGETLSPQAVRGTRQATEAKVQIHLNGLLYNNTFCIIQSYTLTQGSDLFYTVGAGTGLEPSLGWTH